MVLTDFLHVEAVKSPTVIVGSFISPCSSVSFCLIYFDPVVRHLHIKDCHAVFETLFHHHFYFS
jgi:hypothetical protein